MFRYLHESHPNHNKKLEINVYTIISQYIQAISITQKHLS